MPRLRDDMRFAVDNVRKTFPGVIALDGVSLDIRPGEVHALVGENGAGKSTLIKIVTGVYRPDSGRLLIDGKEVRFASARDAIAAGVSAVHQERNLIPRFSVGENIMIERPPTRRGLIDYRGVHGQARRFLEMIDPSIDTRTEVRRLSVAQMQIVEIAKALSFEAGLLLLDEPTASISGHEAEELFAALEARGQGDRLRQPQARRSRRPVRPRHGAAGRQGRCRGRVDRGDGPRPNRRGHDRARGAGR
jgi:ribose transport system ATP-binding protein